jgi:hypothetical protein
LCSRKTKLDPHNLDELTYSVLGSAINACIELLKFHSSICFLPTIGTQKLINNFSTPIEACSIKSGAFDALFSCFMLKAWQQLLRAGRSAGCKVS